MPESGDQPRKQRNTGSAATPRSTHSGSGARPTDARSTHPLPGTESQPGQGSQQSANSASRRDRRTRATANQPTLLQRFLGQSSQSTQPTSTRSRRAHRDAASQPSENNRSPRHLPSRSPALPAATEGGKGLGHRPRLPGTAEPRSPRTPANRALTVLQSDVPTRLQPADTRLDPRPNRYARRDARRDAQPRSQPPNRSLTLIDPRTTAPTRLEPGSSPARPANPRSTANSESRRRSSRRNSPAQPRSRSMSAALYAARMLILSVGVGVLAGTLLSVWDPASRAPAGASQQGKSPTPTATAGQSAAIAPTQIQGLGQEIAPLKAAVQALATQNPKLIPGAFFLDLDNSSYIDVNGGATFAAASTIKVPVLVAFFQDVDAGKIRLDELLTMRKELIASESGEMQYLPPGTQFTALETATKMIIVSDNTATNMLIARLGGMAALNQRFKSWGLTTTAINNLLPDLDGTNVTSPKDMVFLMARVSQGELVSLRSRDRLLDIMRRTVTDSLLPRGLGEGATISHKTGDIGTLVGDVGLIDAPNGKRYLAAVLVRRSFNDSQAQELIRQISRTTYQYFSRSPGLQKSQSAPSLSDSSNRNN